MKYVFLYISFLLFACNNNDTPQDRPGNTDSIPFPVKEQESPPGNGMAEPGQGDTATSSKTYSNQRFRNVSIERLEGNRFRVKGEAQIFEASFGWVIEDGHNELKEGFTTADRGAPEWGNFSFEVEAEKARPNSTLHLIIFETSMKDGSRQHELAMKLY